MSKLKFERLAEKRAAKLAGKDKKKVTTDAKTEDAPVDESDVMGKMEMEGDMPKEEALNESFLKMQKLAGVITEAQYKAKKKVLNECVFFLNDSGVNLILDKSKYMTKPGSDKGVYVVYDLSLPKGKGSFGDDNSTQKVGYWWTKDSVYKGNKFESDDEDTIKKLLALNEEEQVDELFGFGSKIEVTDKADKNKLVKVGTGDLVEYNPQYNNSGYATDNEGVYTIEKIKGDGVILKKAGNDYQSNQGKSSRDISGSIVKPSSLAYFGKK